MAYQLTKKLADLKPYDPIEGSYKIRLDANESCYNLDKNVLKDVTEEISKITFNRYPDPYANKAVQSFADYYNLDKKYVTAGNGSDELISIITSCFLQSGDAVATLAPDFSMYAFYGSIYECNNVIIKKNEDLTVDINKVINICNSKNVKMLIFSNPCNPTSLGIVKADIKKLLDNVKCLVVLDEAYMDFWNESMLDSIQEYDNLIILKTCSKALGLAGVRFGFAVAGEKIGTALKAVKSPYNTDIISQKVIEVVLKYKKELQNNNKLLIVNNRKLLNSIKELNGKYSIFEKVYESNTNFVFIKTDKCDTIFEKLKEKSIAIRKFNGYLRICTGNEIENKELLIALEEIIKDIK